MLYFVGIFGILIQVCGSAERLESWSYINMHCRDNENNPVDWWFIYKPPVSSSSAQTDGLNFTYITPGKRGFTASSKSINAKSMLQHTLSPFYRLKYKNYIGMVSYSNSERGTREGTEAHGIMMADENGGIWVGHTVPHLLDLEGLRNTFPDDQLTSGHLLTCLSLDLATLNLIADLVRETTPVIHAMSVPINLRKLLPGWLDLKRPYPVSDKLDFRRMANHVPVLPFEFLTRDKSIHIMVLVRRPGDNRCLYRTFAVYKGVILDVYQHDKNIKPFCDSGYGLRNIDSISLKYVDGDVYYIDNKTDKSNFAVNTAAAWQASGKNKNQFWSCTSNIEKQDSGSVGGIAMCIESYSVWWAFTNFKVKEPQCPTISANQL